MMNFKGKFEGFIFYKNILILLRGSALAQFIPLLISPLIARLYSPQEFGVLALFTSISTIFGSVINGRYEQALVLVESDEEAKHVTILSILISAIASIFLFIIIILSGDYILSFLNIEELDFWFYLIPLVVFSIGVFNTLNFYHLRQKNFKTISNSEISRSTSFATIQLVFPIFKSGLYGLIIGKVISSFVAPLYLLQKSKFNFFSFEPSELKKVAKRYIDFPKFTNLSVLLNNLSVNSINLLIPVLYSTTLLGLYSLMYRVMAAPFAFLGNSISQVFLEEVSRQKQEVGNAYALTKRLMIQLSFISVLSYGLSYFFLEDLFAFVYGEEWRMSGVIAKCLIPFFIFKFIVSPLTSIHTAFEKQKWSFYLQLLMFVLSLASIFLAYFNEWSFVNYLFLFGAVMSVFYFFRIIIVLKIAKNKSVNE